MKETAAVLVLVSDVGQRETVRRRLIELEVIPISVRADRAADAIEQYHPMSALLDEMHAALAPDEFLRTTCSHHVRLVTLPDPAFMSAHGESAMLDAVTPRP